MPRVVPPIDGRNPPNPSISPSLVESVAGFTAGVVATLAVHPFDVLKTRLQLDQATKAQWGTSLRIMKDIVKNEGNVAALYRGLMPNMIGNSVSWALYFLWYHNLKDLLMSMHQPSQYGPPRLSSADYFVASSTSGILTAICTNPIWVIKTRMLSSGANAPGAYQNIAHGVRSIYGAEGLRGFYRGLVPSLFGVSHGAVQFVAYERLKEWRSQQIRDTDGMGAVGHVELTNWDYLTLSASSKVFAGSITYPYQVVRSRLQTYDADKIYKGAGDVMRQVWQREGLIGFYKGLIPNIVRVLPSTCVTFLVYENTKFYLPRFWDEGNHKI
ncbi:mitochondrial folate carrier protein Flx1 [Aulographum hederae CBS 113979]|uniref:Mitochondrial folate carrier protein Flx1 n=1 Tax=Aulographum hederae CBS 113979 TaxID=1176131 RepID=A0A6G1GYN4_9PEZI|nr:mitochondrial folate carrier protein Flx1 [Aulographum hederae CBS 113979]